MTSRRGRPPKVRETDTGFEVNVRGVAYAFTDRDGVVRPRNTRAGTPEDRAYAKQRVLAAREQA